jgi:hypothetical protein
MTSITIPLSDGDLMRLREVATRLGQTPEELALASIEALLRGSEEGLIGSEQRSVMELEGLGKEVWRGIDAQEYVRRERDSWRG